MVKLNINENEVLIKRYKLRRISNKSLETTIPYEVFERAARRIGMTVDEAINDLVAKWMYNGFEGLYLIFEKKIVDKNG